MKQILILGLLISTAAFADCERTDKAMGKGTDKCQLCIRTANGKQSYGNPWQAQGLTEKQKLAAALNSVLCKQPDNQAKSFALPDSDKEITDQKLYLAIEAMFKRSPDSGVKAVPDADHSDGCDNPYSSRNTPSVGGLTVKWPLTGRADPIGYMTKLLNATMVKLGRNYGENYCFRFGTTTLPSNDTYSQLRRGVVGLMIKNGVISNATGYLF